MLFCGLYRKKGRRDSHNKGGNIGEYQGMWKTKDLGQWGYCIVPTNTMVQTE